jgi:hypothetical protein
LDIATYLSLNKLLGGSWGKRTNQPTVKGAYDCWQNAC